MHIIATSNVCCLGYRQKVHDVTIDNKNTDFLPTRVFSKQLVQGYCRPRYFYLCEVRPPMSSSYIHEIRFIKE